MKTKLNLVAVGVAGILSVGGLHSRADLEVGASFSIHANADFYSPLAVHVAWLEVGNYGRCWRPAHVAVGWRPYCDGHWVWSDCGWYWESDEPWGWACYHYGHWVLDPAYGWIWIPGVEWAPAWVEWRVGGGYIGWAPLAPARVTVTIGAPLFVFVQTSHFHDRLRPSPVIVNNTTIINNTTVINNVRRETRTVAGAGTRQVVVNEGPGVEVVQKATGKPVQVASIRELAERTAVPAEVKAKGRESKARERTVTAPAGQTQPELKQKAAPLEPREKPGRAPAPEAGKNQKQYNQRPAAPPPEAPKSAPEQKPRPGGKPERPAKPVPLNPGHDKQRPSDGYKPPPGGAPPPVQPPPKPAHPSDQEGKGKGHDKNREPKEGGKEQL